MAPIVVIVEISRPPADVFAYVTDPSHLPEWQESVVRVDSDDAPTRVGPRSSSYAEVGVHAEDGVPAEIDEFQPPIALGRAWRRRRSPW